MSLFLEEELPNFNAVVLTEIEPIEKLYFSTAIPSKRTAEKEI